MEPQNVWTWIKGKAREILAHPFTQWALVRVRQPATWRGATAVLATFGIVIADEVTDLWFTTVIGLLGILAMLANNPNLPSDVDPTEVKAAIEELRRRKAQ